jgi:hypothetical protein
MSPGQGWNRGGVVWPLPRLKTKRSRMKQRLRLRGHAHRSLGAKECRTSRLSANLGSGSDCRGCPDRSPFSRS